MQPEDFQKRFDCSAEALERLRVYHALLVKWQKAINLVSGSTLPDAWARHFADSAQMAAHLPAGIKTIADLGSGAGFPGLVIAIMRPDLDMHLVESDERKAQFLKTVSRETGVKVAVHAQRIEDVTGAINPDCVTARALASLNELFVYCQGWAVANSALQMLFLKGQGAETEVEAARKNYDFNVTTHPSLTQKEARLLQISDLKLRS